MRVLGWGRVLKGGMCVAAIAGVIAIASTAATAQRAASGPQVTFTKDVAPILQRSCQTCHRVGEMAPMSLLTYEEVRPWARAMKTRVTAR